MKLKLTAIVILLLSLAACDSGYVCQDDLKVCPDGTGLGREGPQCLFPECPPYNPVEFYFETDRAYDRELGCDDFSEEELCLESYSFTTDGFVNGHIADITAEGSYTIIDSALNGLSLTIDFEKNNLVAQFTINGDYTQLTSANGDVYTLRTD